MKGNLIKKIGTGIVLAGLFLSPAYANEKSCESKPKFLINAVYSWGINKKSVLKNYQALAQEQKNYEIKENTGINRLVASDNDSCFVGLPIFRWKF